MIAIDQSKCTGCGLCAVDCVARAIKLVEGKATPVAPDCLHCGHCVAICPQAAVAEDTPGYDAADVVDYRPDTFDIAPQTLLHAIQFRRSVRHFTDQDVSDEQLHAIFEAARFTPTGGNRQQLRYIAIRQPALKDEITPTAIDALASFDPAALAESGINLPEWYASYKPMWEAGQRVYRKKGIDTLFHGAAALLLVVGEAGDAADAGLAAGSMEHMVAALGLGACYIGFAAVAFAISPALRQRVGLAAGENVLLSLVVGHPKLRYARTVSRKPLNITTV